MSLDRVAGPVLYSFTLTCMAPTLHLLIGLPGSGKTTLARRLEAEHAALRLTPDEWMLLLFGAGESEGKRWVLESELLWGVAARALSLEVASFPHDSR